MKNTMNNILITTLLTCGLLAGCSDSDDDENSDDMQPVIEEQSFDFDSVAPSDYSRVDRMGMPAIATALISSKDAYNDANPADDAAAMFVPEILNSLTNLHGALDDQLTALGFTPCTVVGDGMGTCAQFAVPLIIPDTIKIDTTADAGFPNGRLLTDPVIDVTLAVALLELTGEPAPHTPTALVGALNPAANDKEFVEAFPFLADPHQ